MGHSHVNFMSQMTKLLVKAGHDVTVLSSNIDSTLKDPYSEPGKIYYTDPDPFITKMTKNQSFVKDMWKSTKSITGQKKVFSNFMLALRLQGITIINNKELEKFVISQNFDAAIAEGMYLYMFGLFKAWKIETTIVATSTVMFDIYYPMFGIPFPTSYVPSAIVGFSDRMTYKERTINLLTYLYFTYFSDFNTKHSTLEDIFEEKYGVGFYDSQKIMTNASFVLINSNPFLDIPTPKSPKMVEISGIGIPKPKPVTKEFDEILNLRNKTILISFGSVAKSTYMNENMKNEILKTIKSFPDITFIWKYETPEDGHGSGIENLILSKWVPQNDLLNDERLTLFITHGGMGSTTEVAFSNVPALAVPIFGDQMRNAKLIERLEIGLAVEKEILEDSNQLSEKILEVLNNEKYKINSLKTAEMLRNRPISSEELLIKHVDFACRFGQLPRLDLASKDMGVIEYYNIDIIVPFIVVCIIIIYLFFKILATIFSKLFLKKEKKD
ncbi:UDP-glucuronosyl/UDP-glucosyltransferase family-containing protein [Strongyloides ratti]|uniref:glucuronosyltransferase n=1 Tax=Strongyloides ratti TaxID=34506 RepID=A0A090N0M0_STRRB|nr:UDP-glucuronosyl/UDP-glucosyltransferase family-containing protein [Strongyloides ratti]CEF70923.1 UDP-glucuronosyl/UDP-glucosyltransferase family-containing protein [Strongyloides ratti]